MEAGGDVQGSAMVMGYNPKALCNAAVVSEINVEGKLKRPNSGRGSQSDLGVLLTTTKFREGATVAEVGAASLSPALRALTPP